MNNSISICSMVCLIIISTNAFACFPRGHGLEEDEVYEKADGIYHVAVSNINAVVNPAGYADLEVELVILKTYKGNETGILHATDRTPFPIVTPDGEIKKIMSSCDYEIFIGEEFILLVRQGNKLELGANSDDIIEETELKNILKYKSSNKSSKRDAASGAPS